MTSACHNSEEPQTTSTAVSVLEFFCCLWKTAVKTSILLKERVKPPLNTQFKKSKTILLRVIFLSMKYRKLLVICFAINYLFPFPFSLSISVSNDLCFKHSSVQEDYCPCSSSTLSCFLLLSSHLLST